MTRASDAAIVFFFLHLSLIYQSLLFFIILLSPILILLCRHSGINFILSPPPLLVIPHSRCALLLCEASTTARGNGRHAEDKRELSTGRPRLRPYCIIVANGAPNANVQRFNENFERTKSESGFEKGKEKGVAAVDGGKLRFMKGCCCFDGSFEVGGCLCYSIYYF